MNIEYQIHATTFLNFVNCAQPYTCNSIQSYQRTVQNSLLNCIDYILSYIHVILLKVTIVRYKYKILYLTVQTTYSTICILVMLFKVTSVRYKYKIDIESYLARPTYTKIYLSQYSLPRRVGERQHLSIYIQDVRLSQMRFRWKICITKFT